MGVEFELPACSAKTSVNYSTRSYDYMPVQFETALDLTNMKLNLARLEQTHIKNTMELLI